MMRMQHPVSTFNILKPSRRASVGVFSYNFAGGVLCRQLHIRTYLMLTFRSNSTLDSHLP